jgi:hypothetical protein
MGEHFGETTQVDNSIADRWDAPLPRYAATVVNNRWRRVRCVCDERGLCFFHAAQRDGLRRSSDA